MFRFRFTRCFIFVFLMLLSFPMFCGWIISEKSRDDKGNTQIQTIRVQNNHIRFDDETTITVLDLDNRSVIIAFKGRRIYWTGSLQEFTEGMTNVFKEQMKYLIDNVPEDQRIYFENLYQNYLESVGRQPGKTTTDIRIVKNDTTVTIKGFKTKSYRVYVNDTLKESLWITGQINPYAGIDQEKLLAFNKQLSPFDEHNTYSMTEEYLNLLKKGMPVRSVIYYPGHSKMITEIEGIQNTDISKQAFGPPQGYQKVELQMLLNQISVIKK